MSIFHKSKFGVFSRSVALFTILSFSTSVVVLTPRASAQSPVGTGTGVFSLPQPGTMIPLTPSSNPAVIKGIKIFPDNPLRFDFVIDTGDSKLKDEELNQESIKLIKYFLASLTVPEENLWVNLSPYEKDRIITDDFVKTEMGRDMLAQDYLLKQITASLMFPEEEIGRRFWNKIYKKANDLYGTSEIPVNTFNKVWIMPEKAVVYQNGETVFVAESRLKVMLEEDYVAMSHQKGHRGVPSSVEGLALEHNSLNKEIGVDQLDTNNVEEVDEISSSVVRDIIIPELEKEVNEGENFALLRQIYHSMILATWFKRNLKKSLLGQVYFNQAKTQGIEIEDKAVKEKIYNQYLEAFKKGVYDYIKEDYDETTQKVIPRKYFSGGIVGFDPNVELGDTSDRAMLGNPKGDVVVQSVNLVPHRTVANPFVKENNIPDDLDESKGGSRANILNYPQAEGHGFKARLVPSREDRPGMIASIRQLAHIGWNAEYGQYLDENEKVVYYDRLFDSTLGQFKKRLEQRELLKIKLWNDFAQRKEIRPEDLQIWNEANDENFAEAQAEDERINRLLEETYPMKPVYDRFVEMGGKFPTDEEIRRNYPGFDSNERSINLAAGNVSSSSADNIKRNHINLDERFSRPQREIQPLKTRMADLINKMDPRPSAAWTRLFYRQRPKEVYRERIEANMTAGLEDDGTPQSAPITHRQFLLNYLLKKGNSKGIADGLLQMLEDHGQILWEIGSGRTEAALALAQKNPQTAVIATDIYSVNYDAERDEWVKAEKDVQAFQRGELPGQKAALSNLSVLRAEADIILGLPDESLDSILLVNPSQDALRTFYVLLQEYDIGKKLKPNGKIVIKFLYDGMYDSRTYDELFSRDENFNIEISKETKWKNVDLVQTSAWSEFLGIVHVYTKKSERPVSTEKTVSIDKGKVAERGSWHWDWDEDAIDEFSAWLSQNNHVVWQSEKAFKFLKGKPFEARLQYAFVGAEYGWLTRLIAFPDGGWVNSADKILQPLSGETLRLTPPSGAIGQIVFGFNKIVYDQDKSGNEKSFKAIVIEEIQPRRGYSSIPQRARQELDRWRDEIIKLLERYGEENNMLVLGLTDRLERVNKKLESEIAANNPQAVSKISGAIRDYKDSYDRLGWAEARMDLKGSVGFGFKGRVSTRTLEVFKRLGAQVAISETSPAEKETMLARTNVAGNITESMVFGDEDDLRANLTDYTGAIDNPPWFEQYEPLSKNSGMRKADNSYAYRGMRLTRESLNRILDAGIINETSEVRSYTNEPTLAISYAFRPGYEAKEIPSTDFLSVIFYVKKKEFTYLDESTTELRTDDNIPLDDIQAIWVFDKSLGRFVNVIEEQMDAHVTTASQILSAGEKSDMSMLGKGDEDESLFKISPILKFVRNSQFLFKRRFALDSPYVLERNNFWYHNFLTVFLKDDRKNNTVDRWTIRGESRTRGWWDSDAYNRTELEIIWKQGELVIRSGNLGENMIGGLVFKTAEIEAQEDPLVNIAYDEQKNIVTIAFSKSVEDDLRQQGIGLKGRFRKGKIKYKIVFEDKDDYEKQGFKDFSDVDSEFEQRPDSASAQSNKPRSSYPVWSVETSGHSQMVPWLQDILPRVLARKTIAQSTLIHVDFHPDTEEMYMGLNDGNPITFINHERLVKELWWVRHEESKAEKSDSNFFDQVSFSVDGLPKTDAPVILSIDFDYFIPNEKFSADTFKAADARKAVDAFIDQLRTKNYNIAAVFFATSPPWSLELIDIVRSRFQERFKELGVRFVQADRDVLDTEKRTARLKEFQNLWNKSDQAMLSEEKPGGIDFNPNNLNLQTQGENIDFKNPFDSNNLQSVPINGFTPVIFQTVPVTNIQMWLSEAESQEGQQLSLVQ